MRRLLVLNEDPIFVGPDGVKRRRVGKCNWCGDCCVGDPWNGTRGEPEEPGMCPALRKQPDGTRLCTLHGTDDPYWNGGCNIWPIEADHVNQPHMSRCTIRFEEVK